uniref:Uncharacterized protein n=1 Tax=Cacopsylla melanoneura TaxID=428564 RepID=A0A8D8T7Y4_9HEMI
MLRGRSKDTIMRSKVIGTTHNDNHVFLCKILTESRNRGDHIIELCARFNKRCNVTKCRETVSKSLRHISTHTVTEKKYSFDFDIRYFKWCSRSWCMFLPRMNSLVTHDFIQLSNQGSIKSFKLFYFFSK